MEVKLMAAPVSVITPIMMPAQAQASATAMEFLAPSSSAPQMVRQPMSLRVDLRSSATGTQLSVPASAHSGALKPSIRPNKTTRTGINRWPRTRMTSMKRGISERGRPRRPTRLASKCTAKNTAT